MQIIASIGLVFMLTGVSLAQTPHPFAFKNLQLGMTLEEFEAQHRVPGHWAIEAVPGKAASVTGTDDVDWKPPANKGWHWKPNTDCKELFQGVTTCDDLSGYSDTIATLPTSVTVLFADGKLAAIHLDVRNLLPHQSEGRWSSTGDTIWQGLISKFGSPQFSKVRPLVSPPSCIGFRKEGRLWCDPPRRTCLKIDDLCARPTVNKQFVSNNDCPPKHNSDVVQSCQAGSEFGPARRNLRWDNGVSILDFNNSPCGENSSPYKELTGLLEDRHCESDMTSTDTVSIWFVQKDLSRVVLRHRSEALERQKRNAASDF